MIKTFNKKKQKKSILLYNKQQKGFILIELMVVVLILGLITLGLVTFFTGGAKSWVAGQSQLEAQRNARQAMDRMVREIREASNIIANSTSSKIIFKWNSTNLDYSWSGNEWDSVLRGTNLLISNVLKLTFNYFNSSNAEITTLPITEADALKISKIQINLQVDVDKDGNPDITLNTDVSLRNYVLQE